MSMNSIDMILVTGNEGKRREMEMLINDKLRDVKINLLSLKDVNFDEEIEETGDTCEENAKIKAMTVFERLNIPCIADDSGLFVDYLNGAPGVQSARYAGEGNTPDACMDKLLEDLKAVPDEKRSAQFKCVICCVLGKSDDKIFYSKGVCDGVILYEKIGDNGFGYDPIFFYPPSVKSFAQLTAEEKNKCSHRAAAVEQFADNIVKYL